MVLHRIPGTKSRRQFLFGKAIQKMADGHDGLARIEFPDGVVSYKAADVDPRENQIETEDGGVYKAKGLGGEPSSLMGVDVWTIDADNYGVISSQACRIASREREGEVHEGAEALEYLLQTYVEAAVESGAIEPGSVDATRDDDILDVDGDGDAATDGGVTARGGGSVQPQPGSAQQTANRAATTIERVLEQHEELTVYDLRADDGYDGEAYKVREASHYDPWPVREQDARSAFQAAQDAASDAAAGAKWFFIGMATTIALWFFTTQVPRIVSGLIGGGG